MQADEGVSLDVQQRMIQGYAQMHGLEVSRTFIERGVSGSRPLDAREQGKALLAALQPGDIVITPKLDRMFRSAQNALDVLSDLKARGISLHMIDLGGDVTGNGVSKLVFTILAAVAEAERDRTRERVAEVKRDQRQRGRYLGGRRPFGWNANSKGELVADPYEQKMIKQMIKLRKQGQSLRAIATAINDQFGGGAGQSLPLISHVGVKSVLDSLDRTT
jgi:DNA invertase Pin-like site-specific DNA recombinase